MGIIFGAIAGAFIGGVIGFMQALLSREGIWPDVWASFIIVGTVIGGTIGFFNG